MGFSLKLGTLSVTIGVDTAPLSKAEKQVKRTSKKMGSDFGRLKGIIAGVFTVELARRVVVLADNMNLLDAKVKSVSRSAKEFKAVRQGIRDIARETGASIQNVSTMAQRMLIAGDNLDATTDQILLATDAFNKLGIIGGATFDQMKFAQLQFGQAMSGNNVRAEEFNSLIENTPLIAKEIAKGMNLTVGALQRGVKEGNILSKDVFAGLLKRTDSIKEKWEKFPITISRSIGVLQNSLAVAIQDFDKGLGITSGIATSIMDVSRIIENDLVPAIDSIVDLFAEVLDSIDLATKETRSAVDETTDWAAAGQFLINVFGFIIETVKQLPINLRAIFTIMIGEVDKFFINIKSSALKTWSAISTGFVIAWNAAMFSAKKAWTEFSSFTNAATGNLLKALGADEIGQIFIETGKEMTRASNGLTSSFKEDVDKRLAAFKTEDNAIEKNRSAKIKNANEAIEASIKETENLKLQVQIRSDARKRERELNRNDQGEEVTEEDAIKTPTDFSDLDEEIERVRQLSAEYGLLKSEVNELKFSQLLAAEAGKINSSSTAEDIKIFQDKYTKLLKIFIKFNDKVKKEEKLADAERAKRKKRQSEVEKDNRSRDQQSIVTDLGSVLGAEKEAAIISAGISLQRAIAKALEKGSVGFAEVAGITGAFTNLISSIKSSKAPGRAFGGTVSAGQATPINERGTPEVFMNNAGRQFLLPNEAGRVVPLNASGGGSQGMSVTVINNSSAEVSEPVITEGRLMIEINNAEERIVNGINASLSTGRGDTAEALRSGFNQTRNI